MRKSIFLTFLCLLGLGAMQPAKAANEVYAELNEETGTLTYYYDDQRESRTGTTAVYDGKDTWTVPFRDKATKAVIDASMKLAEMTNMSFLFNSLQKVERIDDMQNLNTANVEKMKQMFSSCKSLTSIDLSSFNTANVTDMGYMFDNCSSLTSLDLTSFSKEEVTYMQFMFYNCSSLTTIYCNDDWSKGKVTSSENMFSNCDKLVGGNGTTYDAGKTDIEYARPDGKGGKKGYFSAIELYGALDGTVLTIYFDEKIYSRKGVAEWWEDYEIQSTATKVVFDASVAKTRPTSTKNWFASFSELETISGLEHLNTSEVTDMRSMFSACGKLTALDLSHFNTANVTDMSSMFGNCASIEDLDLSSFVTDKVTDMGAMFDGCKGLQTLRLGDNFNTGEVVYMTVMFRDCSSLSAIPLIRYFDTKKLKYAYGMFNGCSSLGLLDLSEWETPELTETEKMFEDCWSLALVNISNFDMSKVTNATKMFYNCSALRYIIHDGDWSGLSGLSSSTDIFTDCTSLQGEKGTEYDSKHVDRAWAKTDGGEGDEGYFSKSVPELYVIASDEDKTLTFFYDTQREEKDGKLTWSDYKKKVTKVVFDASVSDARPTSTENWFNHFEKLEEIENLYYLNTEAVTTMEGMFYYCSSLKTLDLSNFKTRNVRNMSEMFRACSSLTNVTLYNFDTRNVENMSGMFSWCRSLTTLDLSNFNTGKVTSMSSMFAYCSSLTYLNLSKFNTANVTKMSTMFDHCSSLVILDISSFDMSNGANVTQMFYQCTSLAFIIHDSDWSKLPVYENFGPAMFTGCIKLRGENGTRYSYAHADVKMARPDGGEGDEGYFTKTMPELYGVPSDENKTLTLYFDTKLAERSGVSFWMDETYRNNVTKLALDTSMVYYRPGDLSFWFYGFKVLEQIEHLEYLNTSQTAQFVSMFEGCEALKELHLVHFDTQSANSYSSMFKGCTSLEVVDLRSFRKIEDAYINEMFAGCSSLKSIYWYVDWTDVEDYFATDMFKDCTALIGENGTTYDDGHTDNSWARFDEGEGKPGYFALFQGQEHYTVYDGTTTTLTFYNDNMRFKREGVLDYYDQRAHFEEYKKELTKVVFMPEFESIKPTSTASWFWGCSKLETIEGLEYLNTSEVTNMNSMFMSCSSLTSIDLSHFNTEKVTDMGYMFYGCESLTELDLLSFNTENVTSKSYMFQYCSALTTIYCNEDWSNMPALTQDYKMFEGCANLAGGKGTPFDNTKVDKAYARPDGGPESETPGYFTLKTYTVTFVDKDGNVIGEPQIVDIGQAAVAPTAPEVKGYTFTGWDKAFDNITGDLTVQALYEAVELYTLTVKVEPAEGGTFTVTGLDENNQGEAFAEFVINATPNEGYELNGWKDGDEVLDNKTTTLDGVLYGDVTITILFKKEVHTVTFVNWDGKEIKSEKVEYGSAATAPSDPTREGYTFSGWDKSFSSVTSDLTVTAQYTINVYTVTFVDKDGKTIKTEKVEWGNSATAPDAPAVEGWTFAGWDKEFLEVTSDLTVKTVYEKNEYTVKFIDWNESEISSQIVKYQEAATAPSDPTREGYTFTGWDKDFSSITGDLTVTAQYTINVYTVTFIDKDGKTLKTENVEYGKAATAPEAPVVEGWTFSGWDKAFNVVTSDLTVQATYTQNPVYTVTFVDYDASVIATVKVEEGKSAVKPDDPIREGYTFTGWDKTFDNVTSDLTVKAQYTINTYSVTFVDWDGAVLRSAQVVEYGAAAIPPSTPTREGYTFTGWDKAFDHVKSDLTVKAQYAINTYSVTFVDWDGAVLRSAQVVEYGAAAIPPSAPTREGYTFSGWDKDFSNVKSDLTVTAQYTINVYTVTFVDKDGKTLKTENVEYGKAATAPEAPVVEGWTFAGWDKAFNVVKSDLTVQATYTKNSVYTVTFVDWDGSIIATVKVEEGKSAVKPDDPIREGYTFTGWDKTFDNVKSDLTVKALYAINTYTVTFVDYDNKELKKEEVEYGKAATAPADPTREGYTFSGWDKDFSNITADLTVKAQYAINVYTVTFIDKDGNTLKTENVEHGKSATAPEPPVVAGWTFAGWDKAFNVVKSDLTVQATYTKNPVYTVTFVDWDGSIIAEVKVEEGKSAVKPDDPIREGYTFTGWDKAFDKVTSDLTVKAQYAINVYTVTFLDKDGETLKTEKVEYGKAAVAPDAPVVEGYHFTGWDKKFDKVTSDLTVKALYAINVYTVKFVDKDGKTLKTEKVEHGKAATAPDAPVVEGWTFAGWDKAFNVVKSDLTVQATYTQNPVYTVTFVDWDGSIIATVKVEEGKSAVKPDDPIREGYTFIGWDKSFDNVTSDLTVTALYEEIIVIDYTPTNLSVVVEALGDDDQQITLSWDKVEGAASYDLRLVLGDKELYAGNTFGMNVISLKLSEILQVATIEPGTYLIDWFVRSTDDKTQAISDWAQGEAFEITVKGTGEGIDEITNDQSPMTNTRKEMRNGLLYIIRNGRIYTATGQEVK